MRRDIAGKIKSTKIEKGQSLMELAVSMILLLILLAGIFDLGRAAIAYFILQESAEEGIVYGIAFPTDCNQITMRIRNGIEHTIVTSPVTVSIMIENNAGTYTACYTIPYAQVYANKKMTISISTDFPITMPFLGTILGRQYIPLNVSTNGVILRPPEEAVSP